MSRLLPGLLPELAMPETAYNCQHQKINLKKVGAALTVALEDRQS